MKLIDVFRFWLPLYASWLLMTAEAPLVSAAVNRLPDEVVMLAALGVTYGLAVLIESPIINLLATATALVHDRASYVQVRRFTLHWMIVLTAVSWAMAFTPLFDLVVVRAMAVPREVAVHVRTGLGIMVLWSAAIAWRRFLQGVLIHFGRTRQVALGTAVRLLAVTAVIAFGLAGRSLPGIRLAATALIAGVVAEALYVTWATRPLFQGGPLDGTRSGPDAGPLTCDSLTYDSLTYDSLTYGALLAYHLPLAGTAVLTLLIQPAITFTLTRLEDPTLNLAAWPVVFYLTLVMRAMAFSLPEVVIALDDGAGARRALARFSAALAAVSLTAMLAVVATPLAGVYLFTIQATTPEIAEVARQGFYLFAPMPAMVVLLSWRRGLLMKARQTVVVNGGVVVRLCVLVPVLAAGVHWHASGMATAAWAVNLSIAAELAFLAWPRFRR
jgi:hypothetical protein